MSERVGQRVSISAPVSTSTDPDRAKLLRGIRGPVAIVVLVLLAALALALTASGDRSGRLDPRAVDRAGSRALAQVLRQQGVDVELAETTDAATRAAAPDPAGTTLLVATPDRLAPEQVARLEATGADLVLVAPTGAALDELAPGVRAVGSVRSDGREPACPLPAAARAGQADTGGVLYEAGSGTRAPVSCYPTDHGAGLVSVRVPVAAPASETERTVTVLGDATPLTNDRLDDRGNAALALGLLGARPRLVWYLPSLTDVPPTARRSLWSLLPPAVTLGAVQVALALLLLALWRARRLGPVVTEPLPVVVRAAETVEGRARLYQRGGARDTAAEALRTAARGRLAAALGLPRRASPAEVVDAVAAGSGRSPADVGALLYGAEPADDPALVRLADDVDVLERQVRRP